MVVARCRRLTAALRWNVQPDQKTTGVARAPTTHSQPSNRRPGTIDSTMVGAARTAATIRRRRRSCSRRRDAASTGSIASAASPPVPAPAPPAPLAGGAGAGERSITP